MALYLVPRCIYLGCIAKKRRPAAKQGGEGGGSGRGGTSSSGLSSPNPVSTPKSSVPPSESGTEYSRAPGSSSSMGPGSIASSYDPDDVNRLVTMRCKVPEGLLPGQPLLWQSPSGKIVSMTVPDGSESGQVLEFQVPRRPLALGTPPTSP